MTFLKYFFRCRPFLLGNKLRYMPKILHTYFLVHSWSEICDYGRAHLSEYSTASTYISFSCPNSRLNSYVFSLYFLPSFHWGKKICSGLCLQIFPPQGSFFFCWTISIECGMKHCKCFCKPWAHKSFLKFWITVHLCKHWKSMDRFIHIILYVCHTVILEYFIMKE